MGGMGKRPFDIDLVCEHGTLRIDVDRGVANGRQGQWSDVPNSRDPQWMQPVVLDEWVTDNGGSNGRFTSVGMWRGPYRVTFAGCVTSYGQYVLRLYNAGEGTLALRDGLMISTRVAIIDLGQRAFEFMGVVYRH